MFPRHLCVRVILKYLKALETKIFLLLQSFVKGGADFVY